MSEPDRVPALPITDEDQLSRSGWTPFAGEIFAGNIDRVMLRGGTICLDGTVTDIPTGVFVRP